MSSVPSGFFSGQPQAFMHARGIAIKRTDLHIQLPLVCGYGFGAMSNLSLQVPISSQGAPNQLAQKGKDPIWMLTILR